MKFKEKLKNNLRKVLNLLYRWKDSRLYRNIYVSLKGKKKIQLLDFGQVIRYRAKTFLTKEPETINWIDSFNKKDKLLDIGANIGIYSLYAALKNHIVVAIEPDALNYALLNLNIRNNNFSNKITAYCNAIHNQKKFSKFNISSLDWGGASNSFDNKFDQWGNNYKPVHFQGIFGITLDEFLKKIKYFPNHIKIDVDGNENLILQGAKKTLANKNLNSVLIELDEKRNDYEESLNIFHENNFYLKEKMHSKLFNSGKYSTTYNHIFIKAK